MLYFTRKNSYELCTYIKQILQALAEMLIKLNNLFSITIELLAKKNSSRFMSPYSGPISREIK